MQDERFTRLEHEAEQSLQILLNIVKLPLTSEIVIPSSTTFIPLVENTMNGKTPNWNLGVRISSSQFFTLVNPTLYFSNFVHSTFFLTKYERKFLCWEICHIWKNINFGTVGNFLKIQWIWIFFIHSYIVHSSFHSLDCTCWGRYTVWTLSKVDGKV